MTTKLLSGALACIAATAFFALPVAAVPVYKPSININFTDSDNGLTTAGDVGLAGYEIPGTSWNNFAGSNGTYGNVKAVDSTGAASVMSGVSVAISGTRGSWNCSGLTSADNPLHGYIDESGTYSTPTVTVSGIPFYRYRVIVYHSTDTESVPFGYDTINGTNYTYVNDALAEGTTAWGNSGAKDSANALSEGGNVLLTGELSGSTLTVVGHRAGGASNARGCIAAIQIIEVKPEAGENDLVIEVSGATIYTVSEAKTLSGTVYVVGNGTLTLDGSAGISAATIDVSDLVTLNVNAARLDGTTFTGAGTVVYNNSLPVTGKGWTESTWTGTVWINGKSGVTDFNVNSYGNANSAVKLSGVDGWISAPCDNTVPVILENGTFDYALKLTNGNSPNNQNPTRCTTFVNVSGSGTISDGNAANPMLKIYDGSDFTGTLTLTRAKVVFCSADSTTLPAAYTSIPNASVYVDAGNSATVASGMTWTADGGFIVDGTLNVDGTLTSSAATAVRGSGTVVFTSRLPSPADGENETKWWKNANWIGAVQIKSVDNLVGTSNTAGTYIDFNQYGHADSIVELNNVTGWLNPNYTCTPKFKVTGTLYLNNGYSGANNAFKVGMLLGSGTISGDGSADKVVFNVTGDCSGFAGCVQLNNKCVVLGSTMPNELTAGTIYINEGAVVTMQQASGIWWAVGGIKVDGTLKASNRDQWGGGTAIELSDNGLLELTSTGSVDDTAKNFSNVTGTGTVKYSGSSWRALPDGANLFPSTLAIELEQAEGVVVKENNKVIGSISGTKNLRSDLGDSNKTLTIKQAKDGLWSGAFFGGGDRLATVIVDPGVSTTGTLTLAGTHTHDNALVVNGAVNLTGTWVGATTVAGTFGGTGTLTGDLTLTDGATIKVDDLSDPLEVSGALTASSGTIAVDLPAGASGSSVKFLNADGTITTGATFVVTVGGAKSPYRVIRATGGLKAVLPGTKIIFR